MEPEFSVRTPIAARLCQTFKEREKLKGFKYITKSTIQQKLSFSKYMPHYVSKFVQI